DAARASVETREHRVEVAVVEREDERNERLAGRRELGDETAVRIAKPRVGDDEIEPRRLRSPIVSRTRRAAERALRRCTQAMSPWPRQDLLLARTTGAIGASFTVNWNTCGRAQWPLTSKSNFARPMSPRSSSAVRIVSASKCGPASTLPSGLTMALPPRIRTASGESPSDTRTPAGKASLRKNWHAESTKQRPSSATCRIDGSHVLRSSAVGAQYSSTFFAYIAIRSIGM